MFDKNSFLSDVNDYDIYQAKFMTISCYELVSDFCEHTGLLKSMTFGQQAESMAFFKMVYYHLITKSQVIHNLFYAFCYEMEIEHLNNDLSDAFFFIGIMKTQEKWYMETYLNDPETLRMRGIVSRYINALKRNSDEQNSDTILKHESEKTRKIIGEYVEQFWIDNIEF